MLCMYGTESDNVCAYCRRHQKGMTVRQVRKKECLKKKLLVFSKVRKSFVVATKTDY